MLLQRLARIFHRYAETHLSLTGTAVVLRDGDGAAVGHLDVLAVQGGRLILEGRSPARRIGLRLGGCDHWVTPVPVPGLAMGRFRFDVPFLEGEFTLMSARDAGDHLHPIAGFRPAQVARARLGLVARYVRTLCALTPEIWRWKRGGDLGAREVVKEELGLVPRAPAGLIDPHVLMPPAPVADAPDRLTIVMPVHDAFGMLQEALDRVARHTDLSWRLVLIEDASPDPRVRPWLTGWAGARGDQVMLLENARNLGFVGAVNRGLAAAAEAWPDDPVVLLNTDAMVPAGWAARLLAPLADPATASVTPFSNDAEIFTAPTLCARHDLEPGEADALDRAAGGLSPGEVRPEAPTGVGFCMALAPRFLQQVPRLDTAFGRGYGEETDWCQKTRALGGRHVCAQNLFVEHRGGASFGAEAKQKLLEKSAAEIDRRYPRYAGEVEAFMRADPLTTPRLALALSRVALRGEVPVYLAHAMGGGAERWLLGRIAEHIADGQGAVVLRVGQGRRWRLEVHGAQGITAGLSDDLDPVVTLIDRLPARRIVYSCGVGHPEAAELPEVLLRLAGASHPIDLLFHDFFPISPSFTLQGALQGNDGVYAGMPDPRDTAHQFRNPDGTQVPLRIWQAQWGRVIDAAARVVVFSQDSRNHVVAAYPQAGAKIVVDPHEMPTDIPRITPPKTEPVIGVLGNIGPHKGAGVLQRLSRDLAARGRAGTHIVVIGHLAPEYKLTAPSKVHGAYRIEDLPGLVARYGITGWFIPSVWPETFSFTTHEVLATGMPVVAFDLGAQGEAVRAAPNGRVLGQGAMTVPDLSARLLEALRR